MKNNDSHPYRRHVFSYVHWSMIHDVNGLKVVILILR